ncbi:cytochrome C [Shewanella sp. OPT22]|uniref:cytochrome P460 family protein n=1 Tax=Parashewanella hymeniacidonis TaxID=2807618 RepID=UPI0010209B3B|nr:cytochrome P460 family protein [Parashewanella hymeniacidonis]MBM7072698.1 cytochrome P460 family protein [Parashewanella hymeniacidonis]RYV01505.1 cytochrome C [Shewanella sp. OPT22]
MSKQIAFSHLLVSSALLLFSTHIAAQELSPYVDAHGNISNPKNVEDTWSHLGAYFVQDAKDHQAFDAHQVYIQKQFLDFFRKTGKFKDGTVLVKRVFGTTNKSFTTGKGYFATNPKVTFVMVKDSKNTFKNNKAWGEGWGWALFTNESPMKSTTTNWKGSGFNNCYGCHLPVKDNDWVYTQGDQQTNLGK